uniref:Uncharacterized protein n=1 Tax=Arion vulgaris TaxID=1028688 RepID=A0A0B6ZPT1_9EUPU
MRENYYYFYRKQVEPGEEVRETVTLTARRTGVKEIIANFYCQQICNVAAAAEVDFIRDEKC